MMSYTLYNIVMRLGMLVFNIINHVKCKSESSPTSKLTKMVAGQKGLLQTINERLGNCETEKIWVHVASLGEYGVARPIIQQLRTSNYAIVLTVFSPSAYEVLESKSTVKKEVDYVFYLPWDTPSNVRQFLDIVNPVRAVFIISEYWINYLRELGRRGIPIFFVSSLIPRDSYLLKWYAKPIRQAIPKQTSFMVLDEDSKQNLHRIGLDNVSVVGDPLFDNALNIAHTPYANNVIERFCSTACEGVLVAGSISDLKDLKIVSSFANSHRNIKCIFVPHEISEENINLIKYHLDGWAELYSDCTPETDFTKRQVLIIDFMGALSCIYRYGQWAYVGGGFTPYLHSVIEPVVYGLPVVFGPCIQRKVTPQQMMNLGIGKIVTSAKEFSLWIEYWASDEKEKARIRQTALEYASSNAGATKKVVEAILKKL